MVIHHVYQFDTALDLDVLLILCESQGINAKRKKVGFLETLSFVDESSVKIRTKIRYDPSRNRGTVEYICDDDATVLRMNLLLFANCDLKLIRKVRIQYDPAIGKARGENLM